jgi:hypothetical protein
MAAPFGLTRFTTPLCVGPPFAPYRGHPEIRGRCTSQASSVKRRTATAGDTITAMREAGRITCSFPAAGLDDVIMATAANFFQSPASGCGPGESAADGHLRPEHRRCVRPFPVRVLPAQK